MTEEKKSELQEKTLAMESFLFSMLDELKAALEWVEPIDNYLGEGYKVEVDPFNEYHIMITALSTGVKLTFSREVYEQNPAFIKRKLIRFPYIPDPTETVSSDNIKIHYIDYEGIRVAMSARHSFESDAEWVERLNHAKNIAIKKWEEQHRRGSTFSVQFTQPYNATTRTYGNWERIQPSIEDKLQELERGEISLGHFLAYVEVSQLDLGQLLRLRIAPGVSYNDNLFRSINRLIDERSYQEQERRRAYNPFSEGGGGVRPNSTVTIEPSYLAGLTGVPSQYLDRDAGRTWLDRLEAVETTISSEPPQTPSVPGEGFRAQIEREEAEGRIHAWTPLGEEDIRRVAASYGEEEEDDEEPVSFIDGEADELWDSEEDEDNSIPWEGEEYDEVVYPEEEEIPSPVAEIVTDEELEMEEMLSIMEDDTIEEHLISEDPIIRELQEEEERLRRELGL